MLFNYNTVSIQDVKYKQINQQKVSFGTTITEAQELIYFISSIIGTNVKVVDKDSGTVIDGFTGAISFVNPLRMPGGFVITGTNVTVQYFWL